MSKILFLKAQFEKITAPINTSFKAFVYENNSFDAPWHFHPEYELTYILKGQGIRYVGNSIQKFEAGDFVLLGANVPHCWKNSPHYNSGVKSLVFQWDTTLLGENWLEKNEFQSIRFLLQNAANGLLFNKSDSIKTLATLTDIMNKPPLEKLLDFTMLLEHLSTINNFKTLITSGFTPNLNVTANQRIDKVYDYVQQHFNKKIKLDNVSSLVSMGNESFCRFFKKSLNKSFFTFVNEYRINLVCKMLIETNKQVSQIAYDCGYESLPFFYRQFQKFINCSPLTFKKKYLKS